MMDASGVRLIVIGNGFDIDLGLPTQYRDFLDFVDLVRQLSSIRASHRARTIDEWCERKPRCRERIRGLLNGSLLDSGDMALVTWNERIGDNFWIRHFASKACGQSWIDFEEEIARVIYSIEASMSLVAGDPLSLDDRIVCDSNNELFEPLLGVLNHNRATFGYEPDVVRGQRVLRTTRSTYRDLKRWLLKDLRAVIRALESYLRDFVERAAWDDSDGADRLCADLAAASHRFVLSFNYTHTFQRMFEQRYAMLSRDVTYCYIHGEVGDGVAPCNMVLGIDEDLLREASGPRLYFAEFRKYFQRIYNGNDAAYVDWATRFKQLRADGSTPRTDVYGHSLAASDKDALTRFVGDEGMHVTCYHHNREALASHIVNVAALIGPDALVRRTGGNARTMEFKLQA